MEPVPGFVSPLAAPVDLAAAWTDDDASLGARLHPLLADAVRRFPGGPVAWRGLPFATGPADGPRWLAVDAERMVDLPDGDDAAWLVVAHLCDAARGDDGARPAGRPVGWVDRMGDELARYRVEGADGSRLADTGVRRRFEVGDGVTGWGYLPFRAVGHRPNVPLDFLGPHPRQEPARYAPAGHAGPLGTLPGAWAADQTGVTDVLPMGDDSLTVWLHAIRLAGRGARRVRLVPVGPAAGGRLVVVAGMALFRGQDDPLALGPRDELLVTGASAETAVAVDLGVAIRSRRPEPAVEEAGGPAGWGRAGADGPAADPADDGARIVDLTAARDATLQVGTASVRLADLRSLAPGEALAAGPVTIRPLAPRTLRARVRLTLAGEPVPARVRFVAQDGRYLPPVAHRDQVNPGLYEDNGADLRLAGATYAYVPGEFEIDLPPGAIDVEVVRGFDVVPLRRRIEAADAVPRGGRPLELALDRAFDPAADGWLAADSHVHFLAPSTALLQAAAEGVDVVHLLATQWADEFTNITDLPWGGLRSPDGRHHVVIGTENRDNVLGHLALLRARRPVLPPASGGPPEGPLGGAADALLSDWAERCRAAGGITIGAHFPLPYAEIAAAIGEALIDGVEMQTFAPGLDSPPILEWYRFLNTGHRVPILGGTDKMTSEVPVGSVRTWARIDRGAEPTPDAWADAVRAGRTVATSGPLVTLRVDDAEPGEVLTLPRGGARLEVAASVRAAQPVVDVLEIVVNGRVVGAVEAPGGGSATKLELVETVTIDGGAWIAARSRSRHELRSAFATSMAAHTSPVYVEVPGHPLFVEEDAAVIRTVIEGTAEWLEGLAPVRDPARRAAMRARILRALDRLAARASGL